jgi:integrase
MKKTELGGEEASRECPECRSQENWKDGLRRTAFGSVQRFLCRKCGYRFSESIILSSNFVDSGERQVCVPLIGAKNLDTATEIKTVAGESLEASDIDGKIVEYLWNLKKRGYSEATVRTRVKLLKQLIKEGTNLFDPEGIKKAIASHDSWCDGHKQVVVDAYNCFAEMFGISWSPPYYQHVKSLPFIPLEAEIDALISGSSKKMAACLQLLKETAMRIGEAWKLGWIDVDVESCTIKCKAEKHGNPRMFKVSAKLIAMVNNLPKKSQRIFGTESLSGFRWKFDLKKRKLAETLQNQRLLQIKFHTFRHWKATMEYHKTKDILYVKQLLGHKRIDSTLVYTQLVTFESDEYHVRTSTSLKEDKELIEAGFEPMTERDGVKIYRKRK